MDENMRIHIIPLGFDDIRVTWPLIKKKVDKVHFINHITDRKVGHTKYYKWIEKRLSEKLPNIEIEESVADLWDQHQLIDIIRRIILDEKKKGNHPYVNVSTGPKIAAIAGMFACMISGAIPYYISLDYSPKAEKKIDGLKIRPVIAWIEPPLLTIIKPTKAQMVVLTLLDLNEGIMRKRDMITELTQMKIIRPNDPKATTFSSQAKHGQLYSLLKSLQDEWGYIKTDTNSSKSNVSLTPQGRNALLMFGFEHL